MVSYLRRQKYENCYLYLFFLETTITLDYSLSVAVEKEKKEIQDRQNLANRKEECKEEYRKCSACLQVFIG